MLANAIFIIITTLAILALAVGVLFSVMVSRRSVSDWQTHLTQVTKQLKDGDHAEDEQPVIRPKRASLATVIDEESREGSAYLTAEEIPSLDQLRSRTTGTDD
ncbi:MAG: hypothetical protein Q4P71_03705 [Actinomycetaceae bacterium]|nr:hypothetical protein [Actinomycetaceae bacterium]